MSLDEDYRVKRNPASYSVVAIVFGIVGLLLFFLLEDMGIVAIIIGGAGMMLGSYSINIASHSGIDNRKNLMILSGIGIFSSVLAFMLGFSGFV